jgi:hypothetical protein
LPGNVWKHQVIYFYSNKEQTVDVTVDFPEGTVTEWYPQQNPLPRSTVRKGEPAARWQKLRVLSPETKTPAFPQDGTGSHYYAARETDANAVQIDAAGANKETDKFVFYRGVGRFEAPLNAKLEGATAEDLRIENRGSEPLTDLFVYEVVKDSARIWEIGALNVGAAQSITLNGKTTREPLAAVRQKLATAMEAALTRAGLYPREAAAMVKTWDDAWFAEPGLRVLYVLPRAWTDRVLPLETRTRSKRHRAGHGRTRRIDHAGDGAFAAHANRALPNRRLRDPHRGHRERAIHRPWTFCRADCPSFGADRSTEPRVQQRRVGTSLGRICTASDSGAAHGEEGMSSRERREVGRVSTRRNVCGRGIPRSPARDGLQTRPHSSRIRLFKGFVTTCLHHGS